MTKVTVLISVGCALAASVALAADAGKLQTAQLKSGMPSPPASRLFDKLGKEADVVYLIANSSLVFGPDPHGRSEEITFIGPVTVPKWPMEGYGRRVLPDGRQQIDIELTQSELTGESYTLHGPVVLGEHPELRSLGTITERPRQMAANDESGKPTGKEQAVKEQAGKEQGTIAPTTASSAPSEEVPADFVVERKVLMTTAKGILYNETAVPVRGRIDSIPPVKFQNTPTGVNVFRGMELPTPLLDKEGNVNGWFYSKSHMAYAVLPKAIERSFIKGTVELRSGDQTETVEVSGPAEIHHLAGSTEKNKSNVEVMMLALRGQSKLLGGDIMFTETFGDRDHFSRGQLAWNDADANVANMAVDLYVDLITPSAKVSTQTPFALEGKIADANKTKGRLEKGKLSLEMVDGKGRIVTKGPQTLYDEVERPAVDVLKMDLSLEGA
jgi:hypothetical protein